MNFYKVGFCFCFMGRIFTGCIYDSFDDMFRVSVMSRHTLDCGRVDDPRITSRSYDLWLPELGPPGEIIVPYLRGEIGWDEYAVLYNEFLGLRSVAGFVEGLAGEAVKRDTILLCKERKGEDCHRNVLAEGCRVYEDGLEVVLL